MAVVTPVPATTQRISSARSICDIGVTATMASRRDFVQEPNPGVVDDPIYVAVAKDVKDSRLNLIWAIQNSVGKRICILHVHVPATTILMGLGAKFPASRLKEEEVQAYREIERKNMHKTLNDYLLICQRMGVQAEKLHAEMDCIEKGIVELISQFSIRKLVMGAASDKYYSRKMMGLRSKKAIYVCKQAPAYCHIQFICKGYRIYTRDGSLEGGNTGVASPLVQQVPNSEAGLSPHPRSQSLTLGQNHHIELTNPAQDYRRVRSANDGHGGSISVVSSPVDTKGFSTPINNMGSAVNSDEGGWLSGRSPSILSQCSEIALIPNSINEINENAVEFTFSGLSLTKADLHTSPPSVLDGGMNDALYDQLEQAMTEGKNARRDAYQASLRRGKAEKDAIDAIRMAIASESLYAKELNLRKELEEELEKRKEELDNMKYQKDKVEEELRLAFNHNSSLECQIESSELVRKELEQNIESAVDLLQKYENERDELQMQRDNALREAEGLRKRQVEASSTDVAPLFSVFSFAEILETTNNFNPSLKIGEGGYGSIFKAILRHTEVAIKVLHSDSLQGPVEFQQEVDVLSKLRHPNLITLIGACPESWTLVYEYLPNGSLEDRLNCKDNTSPLSWQARIRIAAELCSALIFLHSTKPHGIVHGDLKPSNILLDANLVSKLSDFGISRILSCHDSSSNSTTQFWRTDPKGTFVYMDPEFLTTGELTPKSDVYSFGIILLRLLTGRPALGIMKEVKYALDTGKLKSLLDPLAGDWPFVQADHLARLALRCCEMNRKSRPDLYSNVWRVLEPMKASSSGGVSVISMGLGSKGLYQTPPYFICPIFQEVMQDPYMAADGYSYEAEAIIGWLDSGHHNSPVTNSKLVHRDLVPNHTLRSAIQEWLQSH